MARPCCENVEQQVSLGHQRGRGNENNPKILGEEHQKIANELGYNS